MGEKRFHAVEAERAQEPVGFPLHRPRTKLPQGPKYSPSHQERALEGEVIPSLGFIETVIATPLLCLERLGPLTTHQDEGVLRLRQRWDSSRRVAPDARPMKL